MYETEASKTWLRRCCECKNIPSVCYTECNALSICVVRECDAMRCQCVHIWVLLPFLFWSRPDFPFAVFVLALLKWARAQYWMHSHWRTFNVNMYEYMDKTKSYDCMNSSCTNNRASKMWIILFDPLFLFNGWHMDLIACLVRHFIKLHC